jgi:hypothetical protein
VPLCIDVHLLACRYSSGGTPVLLWALGSGFEGRDDLDEVYRFTWVNTDAHLAGYKPYMANGDNVITMWVIGSSC